MRPRSKPFAALLAMLVPLASLLLFPGPAEARRCETITLGAVLSLSGRYAEGGVHTKNGYEYAVSRIDEAGGIVIGDTCHRFEILYYDDESRPARAAMLAERLIDQDGVRYMLGPYSSALTRAVVPVAGLRGVPVVVSQGGARSLFDRGYDHLFAVLSTPEKYLVPAVALAAGQAAKASDVRVAVAVENDPFSLDVRAGVLAEAERHGMRVVLDETLSRDLSGMGPVMARVREARPDLLVVSAHAEGARIALREIGEKRLDVPMIALTHCEAAHDPERPGRDAKAANGVLCATQWAGTLLYEDSVFGTAPAFEAGFRRAFVEYGDRAIPYQVAQAAAAVLVFKDAFERAGTLDPAAVRDALAGTDLDTFYGPIRFSGKGMNIAKPMVLRQIQDGAYTVVSPAAAASHALQWPRKAP